MKSYPLKNSKGIAFKIGHGGLLKYGDNSFNGAFESFLLKNFANFWSGLIGPMDLYCDGA